MSNQPNLGEGTELTDGAHVATTASNSSSENPLLLQFCLKLKEAGMGQRIQVSFQTQAEPPFVESEDVIWSGTTTNAKGTQIHWDHDRPSVVSNFPESLPQNSVIKKLLFTALPPRVDDEQSKKYLGRAAVGNFAVLPMDADRPKASPKSTRRNATKTTREELQDDGNGEFVSQSVRAAPGRKETIPSQSENELHRTQELREAMDFRAQFENFQGRLMNRLTGSLESIEGRLATLEEQRGLGQNDYLDEEQHTDQKRKFRQPAPFQTPQPQLMTDVSRMLQSAASAFDPDTLSASINDAVATGAQKVLWLCPAELAVPMVIPERYRIFYPHIWLFRIMKEKIHWSVVFNEWRMSVESQKNSLFIRPNEIAETMIAVFRSQFASWIESTKSLPNSLVEWKLPFQILKGLLLQFALLEYKPDQLRKITERLEGQVLVDYTKATKDLVRRA